MSFFSEEYILRQGLFLGLREKRHLGPLPLDSPNGLEVSLPDSRHYNVAGEVQIQVEGRHFRNLSGALAWDGLPSKRALRSYLGGNRLSTRQHLPKGRLAIDDCWVSEMVEGFDAVTNLPKGKTISSRIRQRIKRELTGLIEIGSFILVKSGDAAAAMRIILGDE